MKLIATGCILLGALTVASAQVVPIAPKKGAYAFDFSLSYDKPQDGDARSSVMLSPLFFVTDNVGIGVNLSWQHESGFDDTFIGAEARYYFTGMSNGVLKPFVGAAYGVSHSSGDPDTTSWVLKAGAHYFVANNVAITGTVSWMQNRTSGVNESDFNIGVGFTIFFPGSR